MPFPTAERSPAEPSSNASATVEVLAIRHGQSEWNAAGRWQGQADPALSDEGRRQAAAAGDQLRGRERFDRIVASDLRRAAETAAIIAVSIGTHAVLLDQKLRENAAGEWEGLTRAEIEVAWPGFLGANRRPPGFEPLDATVARMREAMLATAVGLATGTRVLVVGHGGAIAAIHQAIGGESARLANLAGWWFHIDPTSGTITPGEHIALAPDADAPRLASATAAPVPSPPGIE